METTGFHLSLTCQHLLPGLTKATTTIIVYQRATTNTNLRRLARRGGVKRISAMIYEDTRDAMKAHLQLVSTPRSRDRNLLTPPSDSQGCGYFLGTCQPQDRHRRGCTAPFLLICIRATNISTGAFRLEANRQTDLRLRQWISPVGRAQPKEAQGLMPSRDLFLSPICF